MTFILEYNEQCGVWHNNYFDPATTTPETLAKWSVQAAEALLDALYSKREEDK